MGELFATLTAAVEGSLGMALGASLLWGLLSVVLSPCHLASLPLLVAFLAGQQQLTAKRAVGLSALFGLGNFIVLGLLGVICAALGRLAGDVGGLVNYAAALVLVAVGLHLLGVIPMEWGQTIPTKLKLTGALGALILGLFFGAALGPCTFAYLAPVLALSAKAGAVSLARGALLTLAFALGHCLVLVAVGSSVAMVQKLVDWNSKSKTALGLRAACGALLVLGAAYLVYSAPPLW